jgi:hypothetical protein
MRVRSLIITTIGAHSSVAVRDTFPIIGKALKATANTPTNQNLNLRGAGFSKGGGGSVKVLAEGAVHSRYTAKAALVGNVGDAFVSVEQKGAGVSKAASCYVLIEGASCVTRKDTAEIAGDNVKLVCYQGEGQGLSQMLVDISDGATYITRGLADCTCRRADEGKPLGKDQRGDRLIMLFTEDIVLGRVVEQRKIGGQSGARGGIYRSHKGKRGVRNKGCQLAGGVRQVEANVMHTNLPSRQHMVVVGTKNPKTSRLDGILYAVDDVDSGAL